MAIDTAEKRRSLIGCSYHYYSPGVTPNASKDIEWRQQSGHGYSGIAAAAPVISAGRSNIVNRYEWLWHRYQ